MSLLDLFQPNNDAKGYVVDLNGNVIKSSGDLATQHTAYIAPSVAGFTHVTDEQRQGRPLRQAVEDAEGNTVFKEVGYQPAGDPATGRGVIHGYDKVKVRDPISNDYREMLTASPLGSIPIDIYNSRNQKSADKTVTDLLKKNRLTHFFSEEILIVLDVTESLDHSFTSTVAKYAIEASGINGTDHQFNNNIRLSITGIVSDSQFTNQQDLSIAGESLDEVITGANNYEEELARLEAEEEALREEREKVREDANAILDESEKGKPYDPLVAPLDSGSVAVEIGELNDEIDDLTAQIEANRRKQAIIPLPLTSDDVQERGFTDANFSNEDKEERTLEVLKHIRDNKLLFSVLTSKGTYHNMALVSFNISERTGRHDALSLSFNLEQQRYTVAERTTEGTSLLSKKGNTSTKVNTDGTTDEGEQNSTFDKSKYADIAADIALAEGNIRAEGAEFLESVGLSSILNSGKATKAPAEKLASTLVVPTTCRNNAISKLKN